MVDLITFCFVFAFGYLFGIGLYCGFGCLDVWIWCGLVLVWLMGS